MSFDQWAWAPINSVDVSNPVQLEMVFASEEL